MKTGIAWTEFSSYSEKIIPNLKSALSFCRGHTRHTFNWEHAARVNHRQNCCNRD